MAGSSHLHLQQQACVAEGKHPSTRWRMANSHCRPVVRNALCGSGSSRATTAAQTEHLGVSLPLAGRAPALPRPSAAT